MAEAATERRVADLVRDERLADAADLLAKLGEHARAADLFERACAFDRAAEEALASGDARRAFELATRGAGAALERAIEALAADPERAERAARDALDRARPRAGARLLARIGRHAAAADAFERAGDGKAAAEELVRAGDALGAARALERAIALDEADHAARLRLGALLVEHGRAEAAVRTLQRIPQPARERVDALKLLVGALGALGLEGARDEARRELDALDGGCPRDIDAVAHEPSRAAASPVLFGRWAVEREVAVTPTARVLEATDRTTGERVAVKLLAAGAVAGAGRDAVARFEREARALGELRHPNVVPLRAYVPEGPALVLAWMAGGSLADRLRREVLAPARAVEIACAVLAALGAAHRLGIVHRDVKPSNVLFDGAGVARLSDFGAAHVGDSAATATAGVIGTLAYMAPEQREGRPATLASDLYATGVILAEMLTSHPAPRSADAPLGAVHPGLGAEHDAALARLCARAPGERPADAADAARLLGALTWPAFVAPRARPATPRPAAPSRGARLVPIDAAHAHDTWLDRDVLLVPLDERSLARARAFARAGHPALAAVLRVDRAAATLWIEAPRAPSLAESRVVPSPAACATLARAVAALHAAGSVHGAIDSDHVHLDGDDVTLAFAPEAREGATEATDRAALARLRV